MPRRALRLLFVAVGLTALSLATPLAQRAPDYDLVIRNGRVIDGMGNPWILADVAIADGRFAKVGRVTGRGRQEIDAAGRYVSPGWIDMMDQSGAVLPRNGLAENKLRMGVTTAIGGEGGTPVPADRIADYFAELQRNGISINFGTYYSESQARSAVLGNTSRAPNADELVKMQSIMATAMTAGAMGMTTALIYPPGSFAATDELVEVAKVAGQYGGTYATHMRDEGKDLIAAITEAITIGERGGLPVEIFHLKAAWQPGWGTLMNEAGQLVDAARARGVDVAADMYVYTAGGTGLEATIPTWAQEGGRAELLKRLADPGIRARLKREIATGSPGWSNLVEASGGFDHIVLANARNAANAKFENKSIAAIGKEWGKDPADAAFDLVAQGSGRVMAIYHMMSEPDIETALRFPWTSIGSDSGAAATDGGQDPTGLTHPRAYGNFVRLISRYVRERHVLTLTEAVRKMTSWPATRMKLESRGAIREGLWADVVIFNYDTLQDRATYDDPRLSPEGIDFVLVNGHIVIDHGRHTGARPGHVLYGPGWNHVIGK
ncbi:MAG TPA: amidohydrolase family protein [Vicinamibacterales bacterium]|nr:amidohydrolase family protein [Vicinamibacterales bacterium]